MTPDMPVIIMGDPTSLSVTLAPSPDLGSEASFMHRQCGSPRPGTDTPHLLESQCETEFVPRKWIYSSRDTGGLWMLETGHRDMGSDRRQQQVMTSSGAS